MAASQFGLNARHANNFFFFCICVLGGEGSLFETEGVKEVSASVSDPRLRQFNLRSRSGLAFVEAKIAIW